MKNYLLPATGLLVIILASCNTHENRRPKHRPPHYMYGMTKSGGKNGNGCIFSLNINGNVYSDLFDFNNPGSGSSVTGSNPEGSLTFSVTEDTLFGMTRFGGLNTVGCAFQINTDGANYHDIVDFSATTGDLPSGDLTLSGEGLYGMTSNGDQNSNGNLFFIEYWYQYADQVDFSGANGSFIGSQPWGSLTLSGNTLYGMTSQGGTNSMGNIFCISSTSPLVYSDLIDFTGTNGANPGAKPFGSLILSGKVLFGMTCKGGANDSGCIFSLNMNTTPYIYTDLVNFSGVKGTYPGAYPHGSLIISGNSLFGMTSMGGAYNQGIIFSYNTNNQTYTDMMDFNGTNGSFPSGSLLFTNGLLYGMAAQGGASNNGCIFSISSTPPFTYSDLVDFNGTNGSLPHGSLILSGN